MTRFNYGKMQATATRLLDRFQQGAVSLRRITTTPGANPWDPPTETSATYSLKGTVKRLHQRYENGVLIVQTGDMVTFAVGALLVEQDSEPVEPPQSVTLERGDIELADGLVIDGVERAITNLAPIPPAGTVVAWKAWCAT